MNNHLQAWAQLLQARLQPTALLQTTAKELDSYLHTARTIQETMKMHLLQEVVSNRKEEELYWQVERHQLVAAVLIDLLYGYRQDNRITRKLKRFYQALKDIFETMITWLQDNCTAYFNKDWTMPRAMRIQTSRALKQQWSRLVRLLRVNDEDEPMLDALQWCVDDLGAATPKRQLTYGHANGLQDILNAIAEHISRPVHGSLTEVVIGCDFYDMDCFTHISIGMQDEIDKRESCDAKLSYLRWMQKKTGQIPEKVNKGLDTTDVTMKRLVYDWLFLEIDYWESVKKEGGVGAVKT